MDEQKDYKSYLIIVALCVASFLFGSFYSPFGAGTPTDNGAYQQLHRNIADLSTKLDRNAERVDSSAKRVEAVAGRIERSETVIGENISRIEGVVGKLGESERGLREVESILRKARERSEQKNK